MVQPVAKHKENAMLSSRNDLALMVFFKFALIRNIPPKSLKSGSQPQGFAAASNFSG
jgi:hypothetical protein